MDRYAEMKLTPVMQQWLACKEKAGTALLLFRLGDFYEAFYDDAAIIARELDLTLTKRQEVPMSGVPAHTCDVYIDRLVAKGYRVALAEQTEDAKAAKGLVQRDVVRTITPGTLVTSALLNDKSNNYIAAITQAGSLYGLALLDVTTAEFTACEFSDLAPLIDALHRHRPAEVVLPPRLKESLSQILQEAQREWRTAIHPYDSWRFDHEQAYNYLTGHFAVLTLDGFGFKSLNSAIGAAGALLQYLKEALLLPIDHIQSLKHIPSQEFLSLDRATQRHLELAENLNDKGSRNTLLAVIDKTMTPMGGRLLRRWLMQPLLDPAAIGNRQDNVAAFHGAPRAMQALREALDGVRDLERLIIRVATSFASPRDLQGLRFSLERLPFIIQALELVPVLPKDIAEARMALVHCPDVAPLIAAALVDDPPLRLHEGGIFKMGYNDTLDTLRALSQDSKAWISKYQEELRRTTGLKTLKVGYNRMFGFYIEVSRGQAERMPAYFERRQTLANAERFVTSELKEFEHKVLTAEEKSRSLETELFCALRSAIAKERQGLQAAAHACAIIDCYASLAYVALECNYVRPDVTCSPLIDIKEGRHPVVEAGTPSGAFIPNDLTLGDGQQRLLLITGPNMAGKSTFIRQVALIVLMAQMGSFVPAKSASIGIVDKIFTRIGASDDLTRGLSTFMVEMTETAHILHSATDRSLVILDEIGRGTSTYDGISIAWSVAEYLLTAPGKGAKTLFATHYWELTQLETLLPGVANYNIAVHEAQGEIRFLHKILKGSADKSYGIHVARLAGLPLTCVQRAHEILSHLEGQAVRHTFHAPPKTKKASSKKKECAYQLTFFG